MYFVYVSSGGVMTAGTDWMSYGSELEEGLLDDDRGKGYIKLNKGNY